MDCGPGGPVGAGIGVAGGCRPDPHPGCEHDAELRGADRTLYAGRPAGWLACRPGSRHGEAVGREGRMAGDGIRGRRLGHRDGCRAGQGRGSAVHIGNSPRRAGDEVDPGKHAAGGPFPGRGIPDLRRNVGRRRRCRVVDSTPGRAREHDATAVRFAKRGAGREQLHPPRR